ncbi:MAG: sodium-dependent transporter, partial [Oscillochloris sp.]|nr:sodium-dependent transporter [Oscillochloris sp.]
TDPAVMTSAFQGLLTDPVQALLWQWLVLAVVGVIIAAGVTAGIERTTRRLMPVLFGLLIIIGLRSLTLPGAGQGLAFLFLPDLSRLDAGVWLTAMGLSFFKLSVGMGTMMTYGSYFREDQNIPATATRVMLADLVVSLLAGVAIFPAVFSFGLKPDAGPALLFITIPAVFAGMPFGQLFLTLFFVLAAIAATGAMLSLMEVPVAALTERTRLTRPQATIVTVLLLALAGAPAALSSSVMEKVHIFGLTFFDFYDKTTSNLLLPLGGLAISLFAGWIWGEGLRKSLASGGTSEKTWIVLGLRWLLRLVTPTLVLVVLLHGLGVF